MLQSVNSIVLAAWVLLFGWLPGAGLVRAEDGAAKDGRDAKAVPALVREVHVLGASVSAGFGLKEGDHLGRMIAVSLPEGTPPPKVHASGMAFLDPEGHADRSLEKILNGDASLVVAIDYLFWFGYGRKWGSEEGRVQALELGLKRLEKLSCPILLGDFPDMSSAVEAPIPMLPAAAVPKPETLVKLNERLRAWAKDRKNVMLVPLAGLMDQLLRDQAITLGPNQWPAGTAKQLLQKDGLHPTLEGTLAVWLLADSVLEARSPEYKAMARVHEVGVLMDKLAPGAKVLAEPAGKAGQKAGAKPGEKAGQKAGQKSGAKSGEKAGGR
ncbi:MAG: hypothetical protein ACKO32_03155 [Planctomycetia bacterium]